MELFILLIAAVSLALYAIGQKRSWGLAPIGLMGLGFAVPIGIMLMGAL